MAEKGSHTVLVVDDDPGHRGMLEALLGRWASTAPSLTPSITSITAGSGKVDLSWSSVSGAANYAVYYTANGKWYNAGTTTALKMTVSGLTGGTRYGFAVKAYLNGTWTSVSSSDIVYATPTAAVEKPKITKAEEPLF